MKKKLLLLIAILAFSGCGPGGYAAPSGHYLDGVPQDAEVVVSNNNYRSYKINGCLVTEQYRYNRWETTGVACD